MRMSEKEAVVQELHERLANAQIAIVADYKGMDVESLTKLRSELREAQAELRVVKNTLLGRASEGTGVEAIRDHFKGPNAICFSEVDPVAPAKVLTKFAEENDKLEIKIGVLEGKSLSIAEIEALSKLPSKDQLLGQLLSVMNAVPTGLVNVLSGVPRGLVNVLSAVKDQKEAA